MSALPRLAGVARLAVALAALAIGSAAAAAQGSAAPSLQKAIDWARGYTPPATAKSYMVSAGSPYAVQAGLDILREGGSAADAAIAVQLVLGLVEPQSSGLGGGGFALHWNAAKAKLESYDGRETAPAAVRPDLFLAEG